MLYLPLSLQKSHERESIIQVKRKIVNLAKIDARDLALNKDLLARAYTALSA